MYEQQFNPYAANQAVVKDYFKRGKVLFMGIIYVLTAIITVAVSLLTTLGAKSYIRDLLNLMNLYGLDKAMGVNANDLYDQLISSPDFQTGMQASTVSSILPIFVSVVVIGLIAVAFILMYSKSRSANGSPMSGATILYVLSIISLVIVILGLVFTVIMAGLIFMGMSLSNSLVSVNGSSVPVDMTAVYAVFAVVMAIILIIMVYGLLYAIHQVRYYSSIRKSLSTVELQNKGAKAFGVMSIINAIFSGLGLISPILSLAFVFSAGLSVVSISIVVLCFMLMLLSFIRYILDASIALGYKKHIDNMKYGYNGTPYEGISEGNYAPAVDNGANPYAPPRQDYNDGFNAKQATPYAMPVNPQAPVQDTNPYAPNESSEPASYTVPLTEDEPSAPAKRICSACGAEADSSATFCTNCGKRLD